MTMVGLGTTGYNILPLLKQDHYYIPHLHSYVPTSVFSTLKYPTPVVVLWHRAKSLWLLGLGVVLKGLGGFSTLEASSDCKFGLCAASQKPAEGPPGLPDLS